MKKVIPMLILILGFAGIMALFFTQKISIGVVIPSLAILGVIFSIFMHIVDYKDSIYGGKFEKHFDGKDKDEE